MVRVDKERRYVERIRELEHREREYLGRIRELEAALTGSGRPESIFFSYIIHKILLIVSLFIDYLGKDVMESVPESPTVPRYPSTASHSMEPPKSHPIRQSVLSPKQGQMSRLSSDGGRKRQKVDLEPRNDGKDEVDLTITDDMDKEQDSKKTKYVDTLIAIEYDL
jgi:hypothetical protein